MLLECSIPQHNDNPLQLLDLNAVKNVILETLFQQYSQETLSHHNNNNTTKKKTKKPKYHVRTPKWTFPILLYPSVYLTYIFYTCLT